MAQPTIVACPADEWTGVLSSVRVGQIWIRDTKPSVYLHTYRPKGDPAPTTRTEGAPFTGGVMSVSALRDIDVYIYPDGADGEVRVDT
jgi:hypothetical protein